MVPNITRGVACEGGIVKHSNKIAPQRKRENAPTPAKAGKLRLFLLLLFERMEEQEPCTKIVGNSMLLPVLRKGQHHLEQCVAEENERPIEEKHPH